MRKDNYYGRSSMVKLSDNYSTINTEDEKEYNEETTETSGSIRQSDCDFLDDEPAKSRKSPFTSSDFNNKHSNYSQSTDVSGISRPTSQSNSSDVQILEKPPQPPQNRPQINSHQANPQRGSDSQNAIHKKLKGPVFIIGTTTEEEKE